MYYKDPCGRPCEHVNSPRKMIPALEAYVGVVPDTQAALAFRIDKLAADMASPVAELVRKHCSVHTALSKPQRLEVEVLCEVARDFFKKKARASVGQAGGGLPLLVGHSSKTGLFARSENRHKSKVQSWK
mgnify:CR=1 FL=1